MQLEQNPIIFFANYYASECYRLMGDKTQSKKYIKIANQAYKHEHWKFWSQKIDQPMEEIVFS